MELVGDLEFLRQDNTNLLTEVQTLRQQSDLLRERSQELERRLRELATQDTSTAQEKIRISLRDSKISKTDTNDGGPANTANLSEPHIVIRSAQLQSPHISIAWDESPVERVAPAQFRDTKRFSGIFTSVQSGPHLIGEAPTNNAIPEKNQSPDHPINECFSPPSPASEPHKNIRIPSLRSVIPPVSGVALPNIAAALLELRLVKKETYDTPAAVSTFMHKLTHTIHIPRSTYRAAFTDAFTYIIPQLEPAGSLSAEWLKFLHDFPSRIPTSHRDSLVSIVWPEPETGSRPSGNVTGKGKGIDPNRRSRSMDPPHRVQQPPVLPPIMTDNTDIARLVTGPSVSFHPPFTVSSTKSGISQENRNNNNNNNNVNDNKDQPNTDNNTTNPKPKVSSSSSPRKEESITHCPPCERDAWVLLLALAYAAFPDSKVAKKMRRLPVTIRLQMIAWMPPGINVYANMEFASTAVDDALSHLWDSKKEILRLRNGWES